MFSDVPNVDFSSDLTDSELLRAYQEASCLLMTVEAATANNAILEALACGLPVVAEDVGGIAEYTGYESARLSPKGDGKGLAASVIELSRNSETCRSMSHFARRRAEALAWPEAQRRTEAVYAEVLARHKSRPGHGPERRSPRRMLKMAKTIYWHLALTWCAFQDERCGLHGSL
jgi:glycosyltransferase involved in cell wall biosynthesis